MAVPPLSGMIIGIPLGPWSAFLATGLFWILTWGEDARVEAIITGREWAWPGGPLSGKLFKMPRLQTLHLVYRPHESDLALYCPKRKLQTTPLRLSDLTFLLGMEGLKTLSLLTWIGILGSIPLETEEEPCFLYVQLRFEFLTHQIK